MISDLSKFRLAGARIARVLEDVDRRRLTFEVTYPLTERDSDFPRARVIFELCSRYLVEEGQVGGESVIIRAEVIETAAWGAKIRLHTDHGFREVSCYSISEESDLPNQTVETNRGEPSSFGVADEL